MTFATLCFLLLQGNVDISSAEGWALAQSMLLLWVAHVCMTPHRSQSALSLATPFCPPSASGVDFVLPILQVKKLRPRHIKRCRIFSQWAGGPGAQASVSVYSFTAVNHHQGWRSWIVHSVCTLGRANLFIVNISVLEIELQDTRKHKSQDVSCYPC